MMWKQLPERSQKPHCDFFLTDSTIAIWFEISGDDRFCINVFIITEKLLKSEWCDILMVAVQNKHVLLHQEALFVGQGISAAWQYFNIIM